MKTSAIRIQRKRNVSLLHRWAKIDILGDVI